jgi:hypothetical protein
MAVVENLDVNTADFDVPVTWTGAPSGAKAIVGRHDKHVLGEDGVAYVIGNVFGAFIKTSLADTLVIGAAFTVSSGPYAGSYITREPMAQADGAYSLVELRSAT